MMMLAYKRSTRWRCCEKDRKTVSDLAVSNKQGVSIWNLWPAARKHAAKVVGDHAMEKSTQQTWWIQRNRVCVDTWRATPINIQPNVWLCRVCQTREHEMLCLCNLPIVRSFWPSTTAIHRVSHTAIKVSTGLVIQSRSISCLVKQRFNLLLFLPFTNSISVCDFEELWRDFNQPFWLDRCDRMTIFPRC